MKGIKIALPAFMLVAFIFALSVLSVRYNTEKANNTVDISVDLNEVSDICALSDISFYDGLVRFKNEAGVVGVFYEMDTLKTLSDDNKCQKSENVYIISNNYDTNFIKNVFTLTFGKNSINITEKEHNTEIIISKENINSSLLESVPIGFDTKLLKEINKAGISVTARIPSFKGINEQTADFIFSYLKKNNINKIVFLGDSVLGFKSMTKYIAEKMKENNLYFGKIEFTSQKGDSIISKINSERTLQVHSVTVPEMTSMSPVSLIERFVKSVRERGVRLIFVRMIQFSGKNCINENINFLKKLKDNLEKAGYIVGPAKPSSDMPYMLFAKIWASLGVGCIVFLLINVLWKIKPQKNIILFILFLIISAFMMYCEGMLLKLLTLILACAAPTVAMLIGVKNKFKNIYLQILSVFGITLYAGLLNAALLANNDYMSRNEIFAGIKIAHFIPLLAVAVILGFNLSENRTYFSESYQNFKKQCQKLMNQPLLIGVVIIGIALLAIVGIMLARSGNDSGMSVSALELRLRSVLDKIVYVRPRTKEFLLGYPCILLGFWYLKQNFKTVSNILLTIGTIGMVSLFNTFCHLHTPIILAVIRVVNGLWTGIIIGLIILVIINLFFIREKKLW